MIDIDNIMLEQSKETIQSFWQTYFENNNQIINCDEIKISGDIKKLKGCLVREIARQAYLNEKELFFVVKINDIKTFKKGKQLINKKNGYFDFLFEKTGSEELIHNCYENLIIAAHGEGIHLNLNDSVLCSYVDRKKIVHNHKDCTTSYCRRFNDKFKNVIKCSDIKANTVYLLSCNSGCMNGELYKSSYSLVDGFLSNDATNVIVCLEAHDYDKTFLDIVKMSVEHNCSPQKIAMIMNDLSYRRNQRAPFVCLSTQAHDENDYNPLEKLPQDRQSVKKQGFFSIIKEKNTDFYLYTCEENVKIWNGYYSVYIYNPSFTEVSIINAEERISDLKHRIEMLTRELYFWRSFFELYVDNEKIISYINQYSKYWATLNERVSDLFWVGCCELKVFESYAQACEKQVKKVQLNLLKILLDEIKLNGYEKIISKKTGINKKILTCMRDNSDIYVHEYFLNDYTVHADYCMLCGIKKIALGGTEFNYTVLRKNRELYIKYELVDEKHKFTKKSTLAYVELYDKTKQSIVSEKIFNEIDAKGELIFPILTDIGSDLQTMRLMIIYDLIPIYVRERIEF